MLLLGVGVGYYLRLLVALGKRRSIEIDIKQMMVGAKEEAQRITDEAKKTSEEKLRELHEEEKKKEHEFKETEKRLIKKDEFLDARQVEVDREVENIKVKVEEVKRVQEKVLKAEADKIAELERVAKLSELEAKDELLKDVDKKYEEDILTGFRNWKTATKKSWTAEPKTFWRLPFKDSPRVPLRN